MTFEELFQKDKTYQDMTEDEQIEHNRLLCKRYPFLVLDTVPDCCLTWLDDLPWGWRKAFGLLLCEDLLIALKEANAVNEYKIEQIKEKFGELRWYDFSGTAETGEIIEDYTFVSQMICINCGKMPAIETDTGWIMPLCYDCFSEEMSHRSEEYRGKQLAWYKEQQNTFSVPAVRKWTSFAAGMSTEHSRDVTAVLEKIKKYN